MQPYFFPYLGYYSLIKHSDKWILFDVVQFIRHGWIERNRILKPGEGWQYVKVPLEKHNRSTLIKDIKIKNQEPWRELIIAQLQHYKKKAPYFNQTIQVVENALNIETDNITVLNDHILKKTSEYIGLSYQSSILSDMNMPIYDIREPDEWALNICLSVGANSYVNPPGGIKIFDKTKYEKHKIKLNFLSIILLEYNQRRIPFEPGLSIIDVMMFNEPDKINGMLDRYDLL